MSENTNKEETLKYHDRLNISVLSISKIKQILRDDILDTIYCWNNGREVEKQCYRIVGPAGLGKTQVQFQIGEELTEILFGEYNKNHPDDQKKFEVMMIKAPVLSRDDFIIPFPVKEKRTSSKKINIEKKQYTKEEIEKLMNEVMVQTQDGENYSFKMLYSDFVPKNKNTYGLFVIDECSRGDHQLQQLLWQVQNEYAIHNLKFPKGWFVISIDNPDDSEYSMDNLEDAAGLRRQLHLYVEVSVRDFLSYAISKDFHPYVVEFIQTHPERLYDFAAQKIGSVYANPASYEKLSDHIWKMQIRRKKIDFDEIEYKASGLLNTNMAQLFIEFARDQKDINPKDIFYNFNSVKDRVKKLLKENNMSKLGELMIGFCTFMTTSLPKYEKKELNNVLEFLLLMPIDTAALFVSQIDGFERSSEAFKYMTGIHLKLFDMSSKYQTNFYEPIVKAGNSV